MASIKKSRDDSAAKAKEAAEAANGSEDGGSNGTMVNLGGDGDEENTFDSGTMVSFGGGGDYDSGTMVFTNTSADAGGGGGEETAGGAYDTGTMVFTSAKGDSDDVRDGGYDTGTMVFTSTRSPGESNGDYDSGTIVALPSTDEQRAILEKELEDENARFEKLKREHNVRVHAIRMQLKGLNRQ